MPTLIRDTYAHCAIKTLAMLSLVAGLCALLFSGFFWARFHIDIPVDDSLRMLPVVQAFVEKGFSGVTLEEWVAPHASAHRIAAGRLLMAAEYKYFSGHNYLTYLGAWLSTGTLCYLYFLVSRKYRSAQPDVSGFVLGMALVYTFSYTQLHNLIMPINALWYISAACSAFSIYLVVFGGRNLTTMGALASCMLAIVAAYSVFTGVITCLLVALLVFLSRSRHALWVSLFLLGFVYLYLQGVTSGQALIMKQMTGKDTDVRLGMHLLSFIQNREKIFHYTVDFLSSPLSKSAELFPYVYVIPSLVLILYGWIRVVRESFSGETERAGARNFYLAMATLFMATAVVCYLGRSFYNAPTAPRYQTVVMLYWLSITGLLLYTLPTHKSTLVKAVCMALLALLPVGLLYNKEALRIAHVISESGQASDTEISTQLGAPNFRDPSYPENKFTPIYTEYESFLLNYGALGRALATDREGPMDTPGACQSMRLQILPPTNTPGDLNRSGHMRVVKLFVNNESLQRFRRVGITGAEGHKGELYLKRTRPTSMAGAVWGRSQWQGYLTGTRDSASLTLTFDAVLGPDFVCQLNTQS